MGAGVGNNNFKKVPEKLGEELKQKKVWISSPPVYIQIQTLFANGKWATII